MNKKPRLTLYGAVTTAPINSPKFSSKQVARKTVTRLLFRLKIINRILYKNYVAPNTYNLGDNAIAIAISQQIKFALQDVSIDMVDWGLIDNINTLAPILFSGSGYYFIEYSKNPAKRIAIDSQFINKNKIPCSHFGVGVNYVGNHAGFTLEDITTAGQKILSENLSLSKMISVRDAISKTILQPLTSTPIIVTGDPALFIKSERAQSREKINTNGQMTIGINLPFHGPAASNRISNDLRAYIIFFKALQHNTGCRFIQTVHFHSEILIGKIMQDHGIRLTQAVGDVPTLLNAYQQMDLHIGGMLHSCILSASVGTPCIGLAYDIKHQGFFDLIGQPDLCIPAEPFDPQRLGAACQHVLSQAGKIRAQIDARRDQIEAESNRFLAKTLKSLLN